MNYAYRTLKKPDMKSLFIFSAILYSSFLMHLSFAAEMPE